jgi:E3 ubiquitin-protein ligase MARCH6
VVEVLVPPWSPWITDSPIFLFLEDLFADVGRYVRSVVMAAFQQWTAMAENDGSAERVWAVVLGYIIVAFHAALYLNTFTVGNMRTAGRAIRSAIRQQMIVTKVRHCNSLQETFTH